MQPQITYPDTSVQLSTQAGVTFENVSFRYSKNAAWALKDVNLQIPPEHRVAVIGETGSGKSTLIHLLVRFWNPAADHPSTGGSALDGPYRHAGPGAGRSPRDA